MKRTDIERRDRELKKSKKKEEVQERREEKTISSTSSNYSDKLYKLFFFNDEKIYNINHSVEILEVMNEMKANLTEKDLDNAIRKAIRLTKVKYQKQCFDEIKSLIAK